jgi:broad specificity phosphatase PhoE
MCSCYRRSVETRVFFVRHGVTDWHAARRVLGQRDIGLNADGVRQAEALAGALEGVTISEILSSPLVRAVQSAEILARPLGLQVARDPRLADFRVGRWEGMGYDEVAASPEYQRFLVDPLATQIPGGEDLRDIRDRAVSAIEQALEDAPAGESIAVVSHAGIVRVLLTHYMGASLTNYHRLHLAPGSVSILSFSDGRDLPRVLACNWKPRLGDLL